MTAGRVGFDVRGRAERHRYPWADRPNGQQGTSGGIRAESLLAILVEDVHVYRLRAATAAAACDAISAGVRGVLGCIRAPLSAACSSSFR